jgi:hypothetical protein
MGWIAGAVGATAAVAVWLLAQLAAHNLPPDSRAAVPVALAGLTLIVGFLVGATVGRRSMRAPERLPLFALLAGGFGGAIVGAGVAIALTGAYLAAYGTWPEDTLGRVFFVLAFPAFGGLGWFAGGLAGSVIGLTGGSILRLLTLARR